MSKRSARRWLVVAVALMSGGILPATAAPIQWADWTSATAGAAGAASGAIGAVNVGFTGTIVFAQTAFGVQAGGGAVATTDYWTEPNPLSLPYTGNAVVDNRPPGYELIAFSAASSNNRLTFGAAVTNPLMAIVSMGQVGTSVTYDFDTPFTLLSEGQGFWGSGTFSLGAGDQLTGTELHAVIQFTGTISEINWSSTAENWHGFTVGLVAQQVPEPGTLVLLGIALAGLRYARQRAAAC